MKNFKKLLPLFAVLLGFALVFTQSAFTAKSTTATHYNNNVDANGTPTWVPIGSLPQGTQPGEYSCQDAPSRICTATLTNGVYVVQDYGRFEQN